MNLPDFLVIGAEKSGTTWLKHNLNEHPQVFIPSQKELNFFDKDENYNRGLTHYASYFESVGDMAVSGEITPGYFHTPEVSAPRIFQHFPNIRIILILRDPVDRAWSNYNMHYADGRISALFSDIIDKEHPIIKKGFYFSQLQPFLERFPEQNILILNYDRVKNQPTFLLKEIFGFIGVDDSFVPSKSNKVIFSARKARYPLLNSSLALAGDISRKLGFSGKFKGAKRKLRNWVKKNNTVNASKKNMSEIDKVKLRDLYREDLEKLRQLVGNDFASWI
jgi:hypothetical protein